LRLLTLLVFTVALPTIALTVFYLPAVLHGQQSSTLSNNNVTTTKVVILSFDDNRKGDFIYAKPILDRYGFKATFFTICGDVGVAKSSMNWQQIAALQQDGMDIESHTMTHKHLNHLSANALNFEIAGSKQCLLNHGYHVTSFAYPYDEGADNVTVVNTVAKNYELARTGSEPLMFLDCKGFTKHPQADCREYLAGGRLSYANIYAVRSLSFDRYEIKDLFDNSTIFSDFVQILNSQNNYNKDNRIINAIPIIAFHNVRPVNNVPYTTNVGLFDELMKYLHDNQVKVLDMRNLTYNASSNAFSLR
jgi:peptidoglycan/xylan/chitin deacetylase (PgdA/CDA1 family)